MFEPELSDLLERSEWAIVSGHHRSFNKWSHVRGCHPSESRWPEVEVPPFFCTEGLNRSLVLGTEPGGELVGMLQTYPSAVGEALLARLDKREGYRVDAPVSDCGYLRVAVTTKRVDGSGSDIAWTYVRNPESHFYRPGLTPASIARILARATPRGQPQRKAKGLAYFAGILAVLRRHGLIDESMEAIGRAVHANGYEIIQYMDEITPFFE